MKTVGGDRAEKATQKSMPVSGMCCGCLETQSAVWPPSNAADLDASGSGYAQHVFRKQAGSVMNPKTWWYLLKSIRAGDAQRTTGMASATAGIGLAKGMVLDGFDDAANAITASGLSKELAAALQALVFYPLVLPLVHLAVTGSKDEKKNAAEDKARTARALQTATSVLRDYARDCSFVDRRALVASNTDAKLCAYLLSLRGPAQPTPDEISKMDGLALLVSRYREAINSHAVAKVRNTAAPHAYRGAFGMFAGVFAYEMSALLTLFNAGGVSDTAAAFATTGNVTMGVAQLAMAIFGLIAAASGVKSARQLKQTRRVIQKSQLLDETTRKTLLAQKSAEHTQVCAGRVLGNLGLTAGQLMMFMGGVLVGLGVPLLATGACVTLASIVGKIVADQRYENRFAFEPSDYRMRAMAAGDTLESMASEVNGHRREIMHTRALSDLINRAARKSNPSDGRIDTSLDRTRATSPAPKRAPSYKNFPSKIYRRSDEIEQRTVAEGVAQALAEHNVDLTQEAGVTSYVVMRTTQDRVSKVADVSSVADDFIRMGAAERITELFDLAEQNGFAGDVISRVLDQLVVKELSKGNKRGDKYQPYVSYVKETATGSFKWLFKRPQALYKFDFDAFVAALQRGNDDETTKHVTNVWYAALSRVVADRVAHKHRSAMLAANQTLITLAGAERVRRRLTLPAQPVTSRSRQSA